MTPREKMARACDSLADTQWDRAKGLRDIMRRRPLRPDEAAERERLIESARWHRLKARMHREADREYRERENAEAA